MLTTGNIVSVPSAITTRYGLFRNSSSLSCLAAAFIPCCGKPNDILLPSMKVIVSPRLSPLAMLPPCWQGGIVPRGYARGFLPKCSRMHARRSSAGLSLHASRAFSRAAAISFACASHLAGSLACAHSSRRMQSPRSLPCLPSHALRALPWLSLPLAKRSWQAFASFACAQISRCRHARRASSLVPSQAFSALACASRACWRRASFSLSPVWACSAVLAASSAAPIESANFMDGLLVGLPSMKRPAAAADDRGVVTLCIVSELLQHGARVGDLELARRFDVELLDHAVIHQHREALHAVTHAARVEVELEAERLGPRAAAVAQEAHLAERLLVAAPVRHHEGVVGRDAPDLAHAFFLQRVVVLHVARHVLRRAGRGVGARQPEDRDLLALRRLGDIDLFRRHRALRGGVELGTFHELAVGQLVADFDGHANLLWGSSLGGRRNDTFRRCARRSRWPFSSRRCSSPRPGCSSISPSAARRTRSRASCCC